MATHVGIDTAVAFLASVILGLILGVPFLVIVAVAILAGVCLAPFTRRTEIRQLAEREQAARRPPVETADPPADDEP